jgi:pimeloyl-ACP methyl ester carboxylesterase
MNKSIYRSSAGYTALMAFYEACLARWPVPCQCVAVPTRHGETHVIASGPADAPPLVLMRGAAGNALLWAPAIAYLSRDLRTYAVDVIGESGRSAPNRPSYRGAAYGEWMVDVLDALEIERASVAGASRGGWLTLKVAHFAPERVHRIVPMCAEGIAPVSLRFFAHMLPVLAFPGRRTVTALLRFLTPSSLPVHEYWLEERVVVYKTFRQSWMKPPVFTDDELCQISVPTLLLYGEQEVGYDLKAIRERAARLPANFRLELIPNAGHLLDHDQPEAVSARIARFVTDGT